MKDSSPFRSSPPIGRLARNSVSLLILLTIVSPLARAQQRLVVLNGNVVVLNNGVVDSSLTNNGTTAFVIRKDSSGSADAMAEFERYSKYGEWNKAFTELGRVADSPSAGLVPTNDGFYLPMRLRLRQMLVSLPPNGRDAFRVFNDAKARQGLAQLGEADDSSSATSELTKLQELYDRFFVTSVGDQIADRLGDARFESGDFAGAAECWDAILTDFPDTNLSTARLLTKRAAALARAGMWDEFSGVAAQIRQKNAKETIRVAGKDVEASVFVDQLIARRATTEPAPIAAGPATMPAATLSLPSSDEPLWQCLFADDNYFAQLRATFANSGLMNYVGDPALSVPSCAVDDKRVYLNWLGIGMALDVNTGKILWRTEAFSNLPQRLQQILQQSYESPSENTMVLAPGGGRLLMIGPSTNQQQRVVNGMVVRGGGQLICLSTADSRRLWSSESSTLSSWGVTGDPIIVGETIYLAARSLTANTGSGAALDLNLLAVNLSDGRVLWNLPLGSSASTAINNRGLPVMPRPVLAKVGDEIYVLTSSGAVLAVNLVGRRIDWAFSYETPLATMQTNTVVMAPDPMQFDSGIQISGTTLYLKDKTANAIYALDLAGPRLKWRRPIDSNATILGVESSSLYLLSDDVDCIDLQTRQMRWSTRIPLVTAGIEPLVRGSHAYVFGSRGLYDLDLNNGNRALFRGYDRSGVGGAVLTSGGKLICVSNRAVTAYPLGAARTEP